MTTITGDLDRGRLKRAGQERVEARVGFQPKLSLEAGEERPGLLERAVARAKTGDRDAMRFLYIRFADNVYGFVLSIVRDEHEAEDVTQEVFAKLMRVLDRYEDRGLPFHAWVLRVARNVALDYVRRRRTIPCAEVRASDETLGPGEHERSLAFEEALGALPADQRSVVYMRHVLGFSPPEIARELGRSEGSIHGLHHRGRTAMRAAMQDLQAAPSTRTPRLDVAAVASTG